MVVVWAPGSGGSCPCSAGHSVRGRLSQVLKPGALQPLCDAIAARNQSWTKNGAIRWPRDTSVFKESLRAGHAPSFTLRVRTGQPHLQPSPPAAQVAAWVEQTSLRPLDAGRGVAAALHKRRFMQNSWSAHGQAESFFQMRCRSDPARKDPRAFSHEPPRSRRPFN